MLWLFRKLLIVVLAFGAGMWVHSPITFDACRAAGGSYQSGICRGVSV